MFLVVPLLVLFGSFVLVSAVGLTVLGKATEQRKWRVLSDGSTKATFMGIAAGFDPLELDEFTMLWPSERPAARRRVVLPELPWPSETWDDEYFGSGRTVPLPEPAQIRRPKPQPTPPPRRRQARQAFPPQRAPKPQSQAFQRARQADARTTEETFFQGGSSNLPDPAEIKAMVNQMGLAGAVQHIRKQTGWDFKRAAQHLAQVMNERY